MYIHYRDSRTDEMMEWVFKRMDRREIFDRTGIQFLPLNTLYQLASLSKRRKKYLKEGHFTEGSMAPKIRAAIQFVENGGKCCIITEATQLGNENAGTKIVLY